MDTRNTNESGRRGLKSKAVGVFTKLVVGILRDPQVRKELREIIKGQTHPQNAYAKACELSTEQTADYILKHMLTKFMANDRLELMSLALDAASKMDGGLYLEFGSGYRGRSTEFIAENIAGTLHGFDSFEGLPEDWFGNRRKGNFHSGEKIPEYPDNVILHKGWFNESVPNFAQRYDGHIAFMHIDCDLYASTKDVFDVLGNRIVSGTVIQFDEYFNYPGWQQHEFRAFQELVAEQNLSYEYLGYNQHGYSVALVIK